MDNLNFDALQQILHRAQHVLAILTEEVALPIHSHAEELQHPGVLDILDNELAQKICDDFVDVLNKPSRETEYTGPIRNLDNEREVVEGILQYVLDPVHGAARSHRILQIIHETWNVSQQSTSTCNNVIAETHSSQLRTCNNFLIRLGRVHNGQIFATGSIPAGTSLRGSDYDYCTSDDLGQMKAKTGSMRAAFSDFQIEKCWGTKKMDANLPLLNMGCRDSLGNYFSVDFGSRSVTHVLAQKASTLPMEERLHIIAAKVFFSKMKLMRVVKMRLTSSFFTVAYFCMKSDHEVTLAPTFSSFLKYIIQFDFERYRMTDEGPELKEYAELSLEAYDSFSFNHFGRNYNTLASTLPVAMDYALAWMKLLVALPSVENTLLSMY
uniref:Polymerase nucleotidyl transferase domain-containing protein n=1 Tax=Panagrolaimus sp. ES5 TaxID=591445 RepID=A0AC34FCK9_9BILA